MDHLNSGRKPHIIPSVPPGAPGFKEAAGGAMLISSPQEVDDLVRQIGQGEVATLDDLRAVLAARHGVATTCPVSTAIFANMGARAAEELRFAGANPASLTPWWRLLKKGGFLNPKLPGGAERQAALLETDSVRVSLLRRQLAVFDFEARRPPWAIVGNSRPEMG